MKLILFAAASLSLTAQAQTLVTESYEITITPLCEEGVVVCDNVVFHSISNGKGEKLTIGGTTIHSLCADGITPCRFLGYQFTTSTQNYSVFETGEFQISNKEGTVLFKESGKWLH